MKIKNMNDFENKFSCETPETKLREKTKEYLNENFMNIEVRRISTLVKRHKQRKSEKTEENKVISSVKNYEHFERNFTDDEKIYKKLQLLVVTLYSLMFCEDRQVIGLEKLAKLLLMSMFGLEYVQMELVIQNCEPNARVISAIKKMTKNPTGPNLTEFLFIYKFYCEKIKAVKRAKINLICRFLRLIKFGVYILFAVVFVDIINLSF